MKNKNSRCLVLNADYSVLNIIFWEKAMTLAHGYEERDKDGVDIVDFYKDDFVQGAQNKKYPIPAVIRTRRFNKTNRRGVPFNKLNIFIRDDFMCLYCSNTFAPKDLTYDHVIPKCKWDYKNGTPTTWTNIATSCLKCNQRKAGRTPQEAKMPLLNLPFKPNKSDKFLPIHRYLSTIKQIPVEWEIYLPESYKRYADV